MRYEHDYPGIHGEEFVHTSDCSNGCGAWMGSAQSGGPSDASWLLHGFGLAEITDEMRSGFGDCPNHPDFDVTYVRYPMSHRPVSVKQQAVRDREKRKIDAILGANI